MVHALLQRLCSAYNGRPLAVHGMEHNLRPVGDFRVRMATVDIPGPIESRRTIFAASAAFDFLVRVSGPRHGRIFAITERYGAIFAAPEQHVVCCTTVVRHVASDVPAITWM